MKSAPPISCELHDHLEVACLYRYDLDVSLNDGTSIRGQAVTTQTASGVEFLLLNLNSVTRQIPMHEITAITVLTADARFSKLTF